MAMRARTWRTCAVALTALGGVAPTADAGVRSAAPRITAQGGQAVPAVGGHLDVSGEAEVSNPWTPAAMRCDAYCFTRARTFFDSVAVFGADGEVHGMLAESIVPNDDFTQWTVMLREGISFTDGTPVDADAVIYNLQATGTGVLVGAFLKDVAKVPDPEDPERSMLKIEKLDDRSFTVFTGDDGDPGQPLPWRDFPHLFTGQWGLIASPTWLQAVTANPELATQPVGSGPFVVDRYEPRDSLEVSRNPDYWMTDATGTQLPYLDSISFQVIEDPEISVDALQAGDLDLVITPSGRATSSIRDQGGYSIALIERHVDTTYLLVDLDKPGPLQDRRVRCAMSMALDRHELSEVISDGLDPPANALFSPGQQGYLEDNGLSIEQDLDSAAALIADYEEETGTNVEFTIGHTPSNAAAQGVEVMMGWWNEVGIDVDDLTVPQNDFINQAIFGVPEFEVFLWRGNGGFFVDQQYVWWHSENAFPDGELSLNFGRLRDPDIDAALDAARGSDADEEAIAAAEDINRVFAEQCYYVPISWVQWAALGVPELRGFGELTLPDGTVILDGAGPSGASGQFWMQTLYLAD
jgi:peptide/nickel transport system substrate-binding protein